MAHTDIDPQPLAGSLRLLLAHAVPLGMRAIAARWRDAVAAARLHDQVTRLIFLILLLLRRLPDLAAGRKQSTTLTLGARSAPAIVAQITRELTQIAQALNHEAREDLAMLAAQAKAAAAEWTRPPS